MTTYDAGTARASYELDLTPLERNAKRAQQILADLQRQAQAAAATPAAPAAPRPAAGGADPAKEAEKLARAQATAERQSLSLARAQASLAKESGDTAKAVTILERALQGVNQNSVAAINTQRQLTRATSELERGASQAAGSLQVLPRTIAGLSNEAAAAAQNLVGVFAIANLAQFAQQAATSAVTLERTQATLRAVAGSTESYDRIVGVAQQNQRLFGGTLNDNLATLQQFTFISNRTGAAIEEINAAAQLLAAINPAEGISGAGFALSELASGDTTSIVERFNLPRQAINDLKNAAGGDAKALLSGLTDILAEQGVTAETLAAGLTENALAYQGLSAAAEEATNRLGLFIAEAARVPTQFITGGIEGLNELLIIPDRLQRLNAQTIATTSSFEEYAAQVKAINKEFGLFGPNLNTLGRTQVEYAQALIASGASATEAFNATQLYINELGALRDAFILLPKDSANLRAELIGLAAATPENVVAVERLVDAYGRRIITEEQLRLSIEALRVSNEAAAQAAQAAADAQAELTPVLDTSTLAAQAQDRALQDAAKAAFEVANAGGTLEQQAQAAAQALANAGAAGVVAARQLANSSADVDVLTLSYLRLRAARDAGREGGLVGGSETGGLTVAQEARLQAEKEAAFLSQVEREIVRSTGTTQQRLAQVNAELAKTAPLSEERKRLLVEQARLEQQIANDQARDAQSSARTRTQAAEAAARERKRLADQAQREQERLAEATRKAEEQRTKDIETANQRIEDETKRHFEALTRAQEDYELSSSRDEEDFQRQRQRLLAEGRRAEANQLTEEFERTRKRAEEDEARRRERAEQASADKITSIEADFAKRRAEAEAELARQGIALTGTAVAPTAPVVAPGSVPAPAPTAVALPIPVTPAPAALPTTLRIEFAPISVLVDGMQVAQAVYPPLEARLDAALVAGLLTVGVTAPPVGGQSSGVGGPRA